MNGKDYMDEKLDFTKLVLLQLRSIATAPSIEDRYIAIENLEAFLSYYVDDEYNAEKTQINREFEAAKNKMSRKQTGDNNTMKLLEFSRSKAILKALMRLAGRKKFTPQTVIVEDEE